jgi:hypothetical protein
VLVDLQDQQRPDDLPDRVDAVPVEQRQRERGEQPVAGHDPEEPAPDVRFDCRLPDCAQGGQRELPVQQRAGQDEEDGQAHFELVQQHSPDRLARAVAIPDLACGECHMGGQHA